MKAGKLDNDLLKKIIFNNIKFQRDEVLVRPGIGEDCAVIDFGDNVCVMSTDPITGAVNEVGRLAVHISCNDIASSGIEPLGLMLTIMVPVGTTESQIEEIMIQASEEAQKLKVEIIGGHTEVTHAVSKPVVVSTAIGMSPKEEFMQKDSMQAGDTVIITKYAGLEGTAIIASDFEEKLKAYMTPEEIYNAKQLLNRLSVVEEGIIAGRIGVSAMHDVTEGGVLGAVWEICESADKGVEIYYDKIPVLPETHTICKIFDIDCLRLISSGCMLITVAENKKDTLLKALNDAGITAAEIGVIHEEGRYLFIEENKIEILPPESDELYKLYK
ncbi:MAG: AIR synthase [Clostridiales bacterium]|nr:AIR synthase [Clostridiales bacterium]